MKFYLKKENIAKRDEVDEVTQLEKKIKKDFGYYKLEKKYKYNRY